MRAFQIQKSPTLRGLYLLIYFDTMEKIKFSDPRITKTVELPSFKGSSVEVYTSLTVGEQREILSKFPNAKNENHPDAQNATIAMIVKAIKSWNFTDENDADLPFCP